MTYLPPLMAVPLEALPPGCRVQVAARHPGGCRTENQSIKPKPAAQIPQREASDFVAFPAHHPGAGIMEAAQQRENG